MVDEEITLENDTKDSFIVFIFSVAVFWRNRSEIEYEVLMLSPTTISNVYPRTCTLLTVNLELTSCDADMSNLFPKTTSSTYNVAPC